MISQSQRPLPDNTQQSQQTNIHAPRRAEDFYLPLKIRRLGPGLNPRTWVPKASTLPLDHRSRYKRYIQYISYERQRKLYHQNLSCYLVTMGRVHSALLKISMEGRRSIIFMKINVNWKRNVCQFAEHCNEVTLKDNTRWISSIKINALMNSVHNTFHYAGKTVDMALPSSHVLSLRLCKSVAAFQIKKLNQSRYRPGVVQRVPGS